MDKKDRKEMKNMGKKTWKLKKVATEYIAISNKLSFVLYNVFSWADELIQGQLRPV